MPTSLKKRGILIRKSNYRRGHARHIYYHKEKLCDQKHSVWFFVLMGFILFTVACSSPPQKTTVKVNEGTIEGVEQDGIFSYKGIPFAAPPVGDLRWKAPQPARGMDGCEKCRYIRLRMHAGFEHGRYDGRSREFQRGLPVPERLDWSKKGR